MRPAKLKPITHINFFKNIRKIVWIAGGLLICAILFGLGAFSDSSRTAAHGNKPIAPTTPQQSAGETSTAINPVSVSVVNFRQLAEQEARRQTTTAPEVHEVMPIPGTIQDSAASPDSPKTNNNETPANDNIGGPLVPSPAPSTSYQGEFDEAVGGGPIGTFTIPPDTNGAVGLDKVFVNVNNNYVIQDKATGARLSVVSPAAFWASTGGSGFFDPQIQYDPYNNRWILAIASNSNSATTSVEVALSQTSDPAGTYNMFRFIVGDATLNFADFPMLGYNQNFVAVSVNMFTSAGAFSQGCADAQLPATSRRLRRSHAFHRHHFCQWWLLLSPGDDLLSDRADAIFRQPSQQCGRDLQGERHDGNSFSSGINRRSNPNATRRRLDAAQR